MRELLFFITYSLATVYAQDGPTCEEMINSTYTFLAEISYPNAIKYIESQDLPEQFAPNVSGRVNPVGTFSGDINTLEYFFALSVGDYAISGDDIQTTVVKGPKLPFRYMTCDETSRITSWAADFYRTGADEDLEDASFESSIRMLGVTRFTKAGQICGYELNLERLSLSVVEFPTLTRSTSLVDYTLQTTRIITQMCLAINFACTGENRQYLGIADCLFFMNSIPFGSWDNADQDNVTCRNLHMLLALFRPDAHCPHVGKDGGGRCVDKTYTEVNEADHLFGEACALYED
mmetsp:Transcript_27305/g.41938  ORF Transcript_27305/g.41938 Transcript_27305/m.41938 type:complete len:291 (+) Transcript_27305:67-939(+)